MLRNLGRRGVGVYLSFLAFLFTQLSYAGDRSRLDHRLGIYLSGNGDPAPGILGANVVVNVTDFMRVNVGAAGYNDTLASNTLAGVNNYTFRPFFYFFAYVFTLMFTAGYVKLDYDSFWSNSYQKPTKAAISYGGGVKLVVPGWKLSPAVGINWSQWKGDGNPWGMNTGNHFYGNAGLDWQHSRTYISVGYNICPALPLGSCGVYVNLGGFF